MIAPEVLITQWVWIISSLQWNVRCPWGTFFLTLPSPNIKLIWVHVPKKESERLRSIKPDFKIGKASSVLSVYYPRDNWSSAALLHGSSIPVILHPQYLKLWSSSVVQGNSCLTNAPLSSMSDPLWWCWCQLWAVTARSLGPKLSEIPT